MNGDRPTRLQAWLLAARPKTLPAAVAPVAVGTAAAVHEGGFALLPALAALAGAFLLQIGVNVANDYFDFRRGIDAGERKGPVRVTQAGLISPEEVRAGMIAVFALAILVGLYLVSVGGWPIVAVGAAAVLSALAYSGGPWPLASHALGDLFVFIFFGPVAVCGTFYVQTLRLSPAAIALSVPVGLLITAILVVNNIRDIDSDRLAGKLTLAVRMGAEGSVAWYAFLLAGAFISLPATAVATPMPLLLPLLTLPLSQKLIDTVHRFHSSGPVMNAALAGTARLTLLFCLLLAAGVLL
jgi:1,4-dihydroxy-2-naphthoate octaprenyltransferase